MSVLSNLLSKVAKNNADDVAARALSSGAIRDRAINAIADNVVDGKLSQAGADILDNVPILTRSEPKAITGWRDGIGNQNIAVTNFQNAPAGFGDSLYVINPNVANHKGVKALAESDTGWQPGSYLRNNPGKTASDAVNDLFVGEYGATPISNRQQLRDLAWSDDQLGAIDEMGWGELNAPMSNNDIMVRSYDPTSRGRVNDVRQAIIDELENAGSRQSRVNVLNRYLPAIGVPIVGGGLLMGGDGNADPSQGGVSYERA